MILIQVLVAAAIGTVSYLLLLPELRPSASGFQFLWTEPADIFALAVAAVIFAAVLWRLLRGARIKDEVDRVLDIDVD